MARAIHCRGTRCLGGADQSRHWNEADDESWSFTTHRISPEVDQDRYYLLQDLLLTGEAYRFGFARGVGLSSPANPRTNLGYDPYVTDGLRVVVFLGPRQYVTDKVEFIDWERPPP